MAFDPQSLQPAQIFSSHPATCGEEEKVLVIKPGELFMVFTISEYKKKLLKALADKGNRKDTALIYRYLTALVNYASGDHATPKDAVMIKDLFTISKLKAKDVQKNFGELIAPIFATRWVAPFVDKKNAVMSGSTLRSAYGQPGAKLTKIVFPKRQNYELFDFFICDGYKFGFSVKALKGGSNTLSSVDIMDRLTRTSQKVRANLAKKYPVEFAVIQALGSNHPGMKSSMRYGPPVAFAYLLKKNKIAAKPPAWNTMWGKEPAGYSSKTIKNIFQGIDFVTLAQKIDASKLETPLAKALNGFPMIYDACFDFLLYHGLPRTDESANFLQWKAGKKGKILEVGHLVSAMIQFICDIPLNFNDFMRYLFSDLNIVKIGINNVGLPTFLMVITIPSAKKIAEKLDELVADIHTEKDFTFRYKTSWGRVNDVLGVKL